MLNKSSILRNGTNILARIGTIGKLRKNRPILATIIIAGFLFSLVAAALGGAYFYISNIANRAPVVQIISQFDDGIFTTGFIELRGTAADENGAVHAITVRVDGGNPIPVSPKSINDFSEWVVSLPVANPGRHSVQVEAVDDLGKMTSTEISLTVADATSLMRPPPSQVAEATEPSGALVNYDLPTLQEKMRILDGPNCSPASGSIFPIGTSMVTCTARLSGGNSITTEFGISVLDSTPPSIMAPPDVTAMASGGFTKFSLGNPIVKDIVDSNPAVSNNAPSNGFELGTTMVVWTAVDDYGNKATVLQKVTVTSESTTYTRSGGGGGGSSTRGNDRDSTQRDITAPSVVITQPVADSVVTGKDGNILISGTASDTGTGVRLVEIRVDSGSYIAAKPKAAGDWSTWTVSPGKLTQGSHKIYARATDNDDNEVTTNIPMKYNLPDPSSRLKIFATVLPYVNLASQSDIYAPHMVATDNSKLHVGLNKGFTDAQVDMIKSLGGLHGIEFFSLAEIEKYAPTLKQKGFDYVAYDLEPGASYSPQSEVDDPVGAVKKAFEIAHSNDLLLQVAPSRAITTAYAKQIAPYVDMYHIQSQALQGKPADFASYVKGISENLKAANPDIQSITIQFSTNREAAGGMTLQETMEREWNLCSGYVDGATVWFSNSNSSLSVLRNFVDWFDKNSR